MLFEINRTFSSFDEWIKWSENVPYLRDRNFINQVANDIKTNGFIDLLSGLIPANEIVNESPNYREGLLARGLNSRHRALLTLIVDRYLSNGWCAPLYLAEATSGFSHQLRNYIPFIFCSEYFNNPIARLKSNNLPYENPLDLSFPKNSFDIYVSSDQIVYTPSVSGYLKEARRILRPNGQFLATFPFRYGDMSHKVLAENNDGATEIYSQPEYHIDPITGDYDRLLYLIPGWDIIDLAHAAGFNRAEIVAIGSKINAILGEEIYTIFILRAHA